jgi:hypothetical protein
MSAESIYIPFTYKPVSHAVCDMSRLENKTRAQQSKTRTQERLN